MTRVEKENDALLRNTLTELSMRVKALGKVLEMHTDASPCDNCSCTGMILEERGKKGIFKRDCSDCNGTGFLRVDWHLMDTNDN